MEAHGMGDFPPASIRGRFIAGALGAAVVDVLLPRFVDQLVAARSPASR